MDGINIMSLDNINKSQLNFILPLLSLELTKAVSIISGMFKYAATGSSPFPIKYLKSVNIKLIKNESIYYFVERNLHFKL